MGKRKGGGSWDPLFALLPKKGQLLPFLRLWKKKENYKVGGLRAWG